MPRKKRRKPRSKRQVRAMFAAARGKSKLGIPKKVGREYTRAVKGKRGAVRRLPEKRRNAPSEYMGRCTRIEYVNAADHRAYYHDFGAGVSIYANADGTVVLMGKKPLVGERLV